MSVHNLSVLSHVLERDFKHFSAQCTPVEMTNKWTYSLQPLSIYKPNVKHFTNSSTWTYKNSLWLTHATEWRESHACWRMHGNSYLGVYVLNILIHRICVACLRVFIYLCVQVYQIRIFGSTWPREHASTSIIGLSSIRIEIQLQCVKTQTLIQDAGVAGKRDRYYRVEATELQNLQKSK